MFACCWLIVPVLFFSISQSKLPGYILPAIPAGALLLADYLRQHLDQRGAWQTPTGLAVLHALLAGGPIVPALLIAYLVRSIALPAGRPMLVALAAAFVLCAGIALTLVRRNGLRMLRFVTLIPVLLTVGVVVEIGSRVSGSDAFRAAAGSGDCRHRNASAAAGGLPCSARTGIWTALFIATSSPSTTIGVAFRAKSICWWRRRIRRPRFEVGGGPPRLLPRALCGAACGLLLGCAAAGTAWRSHLRPLLPPLCSAGLPRVVRTH